MIPNHATYQLAYTLIRLVDREGFEPITLQVLNLLPLPVGLPIEKIKPNCQTSDALLERTILDLLKIKEEVFVTSSRSPSKIGLEVNLADLLA